jgi:riboflavin synthase
MFTGLIESIGKVADLVPARSGFRLRVTTNLAAELTAGESVAVNGVCLTAIPSESGDLEADVSPETARVTTLGTLRPGSLVNLERPLRADARIGGHFVQGHVDATARIDDIRQEGESWWLTIEYPESLGAFIVRKGSVAVDGISLTVAGVDAAKFDVQIIPFTWHHTNLHAARVNDQVNLECDILGKYAVRAVQATTWLPPSGGR